MMQLASKTATSAPTSILVVDDERLIRWSLRERLAQAGYTVVVARDGRQALDRLADPIGLVLLDLRLPDTDGLALLGAIRQRRPDCRVVLMTAHGSPEVAREAIALGAYRVVDKPFNLDEMARLADEAIGSGH